jgi:hypothetical protein
MSRWTACPAASDAASSPPTPISRASLTDRSAATRAGRRAKAWRASSSRSAAPRSGVSTALLTFVVSIPHPPPEASPVRHDAERLLLLRGPHHPRRAGYPRLSVRSAGAVLCTQAALRISCGIPVGAPSRGTSRPASGLANDTCSLSAARIAPAAKMRAAWRSRSSGLVVTTSSCFPINSTPLLSVLPPAQ